MQAHKKELNSLYPDVDIHPRQFDASDEKAVAAVVEEAVKNYGRLDVFFANAGIVGKPAMFSDFDDAEFMDVMKVNTLR